MRGIRRILRSRLDLWEAALIALLIGVVLYAATRPPWGEVQSAREIEYFRQTYGPNRYSEREEEWLIRDFFSDRRGGFFVDVGAHHYRETSKTYYLEKELGWSGIAVEPQREFAEDYVTHRPRTRFFPFFVSSASNEMARLFVHTRNRSVASSHEEFARLFGQPDEVREVPTVSLTDLLDAEGVTSIDFLSMDIELHEPEALRGFDIKRFRPSLVCIEGLAPVRQQILNYFARNGYVIVGRYIWVDRENFYFMPLPPDDEVSPADGRSNTTH
jgi:FkbM family methyltransferase